LQQKSIIFVDTADVILEDNEEMIEAERFHDSASIEMTMVTMVEVMGMMMTVETIVWTVGKLIAIPLTIIKKVRMSMKKIAVEAKSRYLR
jgi:hypothetical protein